MPLSQTERAALEAAMQAIEGASRAEVVVSIRGRSVPPDRGPLLLGGVVAVALSAFLLFSPWEFSLMTIWTAPPFAGLLVGIAGDRVPALESLLASRTKRREAVLRAARAAFVERGVGHTRERTGILVYLSLREREAVVVADRGVADLVPTDAWREAVERVEAAARSGSGIEGVAGALAAIRDTLARELPRRADDVNELPDVAEAS